MEEQKMEPYKSDFFYVNVFFLKVSGIWPPDDKTTRAYKCYGIFQKAVICVAVIYTTFALLKSVYDYRHNMNLLIEVTNVDLTLFLAMAKMIFWLKNGDKVKIIMNRLENSGFRYGTIEDFDTAAIVKRAKTAGMISCLTLWTLSQCTVMVTYAPPVSMRIYYYLNDVPTANMTTFDHLPFRSIYVPFKHDTSILRYFLACLVQWVPLHFHINAYTGVDGVFMNIINLLGTHMLVLQGAFKTLRRACLKKVPGPALTPDGLYNSDQLENEMMSEMRKRIRHLQMIFKSCHEAEDVFQVLSFFQAIGSAYLFCSCLLMLSTMPIYTNMFFMEVLYVMGGFVQLCLYCWSGNELTLKTNNVSQGIWDGDWLETRKPFKDYMIMTMTKLQLPLYFTAGKFVPLILSTQIAVTKGSYSYYTLLKTMKKQG